jgi:hypothetical protein
VKTCFGTGWERQFCLPDLGTGVQAASLFPQSFADIATVLSSFAQPAVCLSGCELLPSDGRTLEEVASAAGIGVRAVAPDAVVAATSEFVQVLDAPFENLAVFDCPANFDTASLLASVSAVRDWAASGGSGVLHTLPASRVCVHSHDDCYVSVEWRDREALRAHLALLAQDLVASHLPEPMPLSEEDPYGCESAAERRRANIPQPPGDLLDSMLKLGPCIRIFEPDVRREGMHIMIGCCHPPRLHRFGPVRHEIAATLAFNAGTGAWSWTRLEQVVESRATPPDLDRAARWHRDIRTVLVAELQAGQSVRAGEGEDDYDVHACRISGMLMEHQARIKLVDYLTGIEQSGDPGRAAGLADRLVRLREELEKIPPR